MRLDTVFDTDDEAGFIYRWFLRKRDEVLTDNIVFFLHYHVTSALFYIACILVTVGMLIGDPIDCVTDQAVDSVIDNFCLYHSTFTNAAAAENLTSHPGIAPTVDTSSEDRKYHNYYLWVAILLVIQGSLFYIPRGIWKAWGGSRVDDILKRKDEAFSLSNEDDSDANNQETPSDTVATEKEDLLKRRNGKGDLIKKDPISERVEVDELPEKNFKRLTLYILSKSHYFYYWKLLACEFLNLANAFLQLLLMNKFLGLGLSKDNYWYNKDILQLFQDRRPEERTGIVEHFFPKITACTFWTYGPSGSIVNYQAICVLPINAMNEKIYAILYVWLLFLIAVSMLAVLYRLLIIIPFVRNLLLKVHLRSDELGKFSLLILRKRLPLGNWQLLLQLVGNSNMDSWELTNVVKYLSRRCEAMERITRGIL